MAKPQLQPHTKEPIPSSSKSTGRKHILTRDDLLKRLALLNTLPFMLPPTLPPSPPTSRSTSPVPGPSLSSAKRKPEVGLETDRLKRPRTNSSASAHRGTYSANTHYLPRSELAEDGEVAEEQLTSRSHPLPPRAAPIQSLSEPANSFVPVRRPRRGLQQNLLLLPILYEKYHQAGRKLKYSGDARFWSTYPPSHKEYRPIPNPPPSNSPYHTHGGLVAKLELLDGLIMFTYSLWCKEYGKPVVASTWRTMEDFIRWCRDKWEPDEGSSEAERAFYGLICMIRGFIHARIEAHCSDKSESDVNDISARTRAEIETAISKAPGSLPGNKSQSTPPMLPSPASIGTANSANSTPTNRDSTPNSADIRSSSIVNAPPPSSEQPIPVSFLPSDYQSGIQSPSIIAAANTVRPTLSVLQLENLNEREESRKVHSSEISVGRDKLDLPIMLRNFPRTHARMMYTALKFTDEHEVDFEDNDGELYWPGEGTRGEGLGWLCHMGEAMIKEFGKQFGYNGLKGVVPKPEQPRYDPRIRPHSNTNSSQR